LGQFQKNLDYPGVGPEHSYLKDAERARYVAITDSEALEGFDLLARSEGILPALEPSHAIAYLKTLAKELEVPVLALSQLSRQVESREDKRPQLSDLRESGSIEQDADVVMFIFREEYYLEKAEPIHNVDEARDRFEDRVVRWNDRIAEVRNTASIIIAKQRHGPVGAIDVYFDGSLTRFADLDRHHDDSDAPY